MNDTKFGPDDLVVNYSDACLYGRDLLVLRSNDWLNADCIHYQFQRLQQEHCSDHKTLLFDPSAVSFFMHQCQDDEELNDFASGYNDRFASTERLLIPISDDMKTSANWGVPGRGTHWSLLLLILEKQQDEGKSASSKAFHFDSIPGSGNMQAACAVAAKFHQLLQNLGVIHVSEKSIRECAVPRQKNGYDCGIHVLVTAEILVRGDHCDEMQVGERLKGMFMVKPNLCSDVRAQIAEDALIQAAKSSNT